MIPAEVVARARASFLGLALGDALGATTEFMTAAEIRARLGVHRKIVGGGWLGLKPGRVTDDTEMSLCLARAIADARGWDRRAAAERLAAWLRSRPIDVGDTCRRGIRAYMLHGQLETPPNPWDGGNGAAMRVAPGALFALGDEALLERVVLEQAHLTHNHPLSDAACVAVGLLVQRAVLGGDREALEAVARALGDRHSELDYRRYDGRSSGYVAETLRTVLHFFFTTRRFDDCLVGVVNQGGDADTTGAIAGSVAGAFYGLEALPPRWLGRLAPAVRAEIWDLAERLVLLSPAARRRDSTGAATSSSADQTNL